MLSLRKIFATTALLIVGANAFAVDCDCRLQTGDSWIIPKDIIKYYPRTDVSRGMGSNSAENKCSRACQDFAKNDSGAAAASCAKVANGSRVYAISKAGSIPSGRYDHYMGTLVNKPAVYKCTQGGNVVGTNCVVSVSASAKCPKDYWLENHKKPFQCVKQACAQGSMPGVPAWLAIGGAVNGGKYLTDDKGGSRFFVNATLSCESGYSLNGENCVKTYPATLVSPAECKF